MGRFFDKTNIEEIYRQHAPMIFRRARGVLANEAEAHEIVQQIFLDLLEGRNEFSGTSSVTTWLYSVTTHLCLNRLRDGRNRSRLLDQQVAPAGESTSTGGAEERATLHQLLRRLPEELAMVAIHYYLDEMTQDEIAEVMGCSRRHVGNLVVRLQEHVAALERVS
jgi:RNA polymerase sigma factor (sigma-70 family)